MPAFLHKNPFDHESVAARYNLSRPYFHPHVVSRIKARLALSAPFDRALDVGCGTGLSSRALLEIARRVDASDPSEAMLRHAHRDPALFYRRAEAGSLEYEDRAFDLMALSQSVHWADQPKFFSEARRLIKPGGVLALYDHFFLWKADPEQPFSRWFRERYQVRFPAPPRSGQPDPGLAPDGFSLLHYEEFAFPSSYDLEHLIRYLITQSNVCSACDARGAPIEEAIDWLRAELGPFFRDPPTLTLPAGGPITLFSRRAE